MKRTESKEDPSEDDVERGELNEAANPKIAQETSDDGSQKPRQNRIVTVLLPVLLLFLAVVAAIIGGVCGSGLCGSSNGTGEVQKPSRGGFRGCGSSITCNAATKAPNATNQTSNTTSAPTTAPAGPNKAGSSPGGGSHGYLPGGPGGPGDMPGPGEENFEPGQLTAGDVDDNLNFEWYLKYQERELAQDSEYQPVLPRPFLKDRVPIQVFDRNGKPFPCAEVKVGGKTFTTGTNGKLSLFPTVDELTRSTRPWKAQIKPPNGNCPEDCVTTTIPASGAAPETHSLVEAPDEASQSLHKEVKLHHNSRVSSLPGKLDLALLMDTTGSMCDEIDYLKEELGQILNEAAPGIDIQLAYIAYKSRGDSYEVRTSPFGSTPNLAAELGTEVCNGGGSGELVNEALEAASRLEWRKGNVARLALIVGDEPPHESLKEHMQEAFDAALVLRRLGVRVYGLAASGTNKDAEYLFRLSSFVTGARYLWLTDDSGIGLPHAEPKVLCYQVTHLNRLLYRVIRSELIGRRVEADPLDVIREVGQQEAGVCVNNLNQPHDEEKDEDETI